MNTTTNSIIINRGRGPEIAGTRITVYDVLDYTRIGWEPPAIADLFEVSPEQVAAAIEYIEANKEAVMVNYQRILDRAAQGNPPEVLAVLEESRAKLQAELARLKELERNGTPHA